METVLISSEQLDLILTWFLTLTCCISFCLGFLANEMGAKQMIIISDIAEVSGYVIGSFFIGYLSSYLLYVVRRSLWLSTR